MSVSLYCAVSSKNGNFLLTEENKTMSHGCPLLMRSLFTRISLYFPYPTINTTWNLKLKDFVLRQKKKITQAISKVIPWVPEVFSHGPMILRFGGHAGQTKT